MFLIVAILQGCVSSAKLDQATLEGADFGAYPENYEEIIKQLFLVILKDPLSAQYEISKPYKGYLREAPILGGDAREFGYIIETRVNAKNSFGGYTGYKLRRYFYKNGRLHYIEPNPQYFSERWYQ
jgi:hypothetical protein